MEKKTKRISLEDARWAVLGTPHHVETETVRLQQSLGRIAAETACSSVMVPPFAKSPLDGYALISADTAGASGSAPVQLDITETIAAGDAPRYPLLPGQAAKILTGAPMPANADCVVRFEETEFTDIKVKIFNPQKSRSNFVPEGDDIRKGDVILREGEIIVPAHLGMMASVDIMEIAVYKRPRISLINTGSELTEPGEPLLYGQIRNSARYVIGAILTQAGADVRDGLTVPDQAQPLTELLAAELEYSDMAVTTGGVSVGDYDMVREAVRRLGAKELFWKVAFRPGGTILAAEYRGKLILGLSGNPASAALGLFLLGLPYVRRLGGQRKIYPQVVKAVLAAPVRKDSPYGRLVRGAATLENGRMYLVPATSEGNGAISSLIDCELIADLPAGTPPLEKGAEVNAFWLASLTENSSDEAVPAVTDCGEYDEIAENIFFPIYGYIAGEIIRLTGIVSGRMVDIGCGGGHLGMALMQATGLIGTFVDIQMAAISKARERARERGLGHRCDYLVNDVVSMDLPDGYADIVISRGSMIFWENQPAAFDEIWRILAPGGKTYIGTGMGKAELRAQVQKKMEGRRGECWQQRLRDKSRALTTDEYGQLFSSRGWPYEIIDDPGKGRWIILSKPEV